MTSCFHGLKSNENRKTVDNNLSAMMHTGPLLIGDTQYQAIIEKVVGYLFGFLLLAAGIWKWIPGIIELDLQRKQALDDASEEIKVLSGLLPICMDCKKIRDDSGYWNQLEKYISEHSEVKLSHGICEECLDKRMLELETAS